MDARVQLSAKYIRGSGLEIGALHYPLEVPEGVSVTYVDFSTYDEVMKRHGDVKPKITDWIVDDAEKMEKFQAQSQDFIIANHVLEHCENAIGTLERWTSLLKHGGLLYIALPEKNHTFDRKRQITSFEHLKEEFLAGKGWGTNARPIASFQGNRFAHYVDWYQNSELEKDNTPSDVARKVCLALQHAQNIHWHVWDYLAMVELFHAASRFCGYEVLDHQENGTEVIWILRRK